MTAQIHERMILDGVEMSMAFCPPLPKNHPRIVANDNSEQTSTYQHTACWRGYQGTWEVRDGRFYLVSIAGSLQLVGTDPLLAEWFSGTIRLPRGELLQYVHMGFGSVYQEEVHVEVARGCVTNSRVIDNRGRDHDRAALGS